MCPCRFIDCISDEGVTVWETVNVYGVGGVFMGNLSTFQSVLL